MAVITMSGFCSVALQLLLGWSEEVSPSLSGEKKLCDISVGT